LLTEAVNHLGKLCQTAILLWIAPEQRLFAAAKLILFMKGISA